jgi:hypothetical protein
MNIEPTRTRQNGTRATLAKSGEEIIVACRQIVAERSYAKINGVTVDLFSAGAIVAVYDALNDANKAKFRNLPVAKMTWIALQLLK